MQFRLTRVAPFSAAKTLALYYALGGLVSSCVKYAHAWSAPETTQTPIDTLTTVVGFGIGGFLGTLVLAFVFNAIASVSGGIVVTLESVPCPARDPSAP